MGCALSLCRPFSPNVAGAATLDACCVLFVLECGQVGHRHSVPLVARAAAGIKNQDRNMYGEY